MNGRTFFRIVIGLVIVAVLIGAGVFVYNLGVAQGLAQAPQLAERLGDAPFLRGGPGMMPWMHYGGWGFRPFGWGFGIFGFLIPLLFFLGLFWLISRLFFWGRWGRGPGHWEQRGQQMFEEWHRRAHGEGSGQAPPSTQG